MDKAFEYFYYLCSAIKIFQEMSNDSLLAVSPVDGRYLRQTEPLREYFSEYALIRYRVRVEIEYFIALCQIPLPQLADFDTSIFEALRDIYRNMTPEDAAKVKEIEKVTNHLLRSCCEDRWYRSSDRRCCYLRHRNQERRSDRC